MPHPAPLRDLLQPGAGLILPGAFDAMAARLVEAAGFPALYLTGAGVANAWLGAPDMGLVSVTEVTAHIAACREAVAIPIVADGDTGIGAFYNTDKCDANLHGRQVLVDVVQQTNRNSRVPVAFHFFSFQARAFGREQCNFTQNEQPVQDDKNEDYNYFHK